MKTILYLTFQSFSQYPSYKRALGTGEELSRLGCKVYIALTDTKENRRRFAAECEGCEPIWVPAKSCLFDIGYKLKAIWRIRPDVVYSLSYSLRNLMFLSFLFPRRCKYILEYCELYSSYKWPWKIREMISLFEVDGLVCASRYLAEVFGRRLKKIHRNIPITYQPYAFPKYLSGKNENARPRSVVFMASLWPNYGVYDVIDAFVMALSKYSDMELEILGSGPEKERVINKVGSLKCGEKIHVRGFVPEQELDNYFKRASAFVAPMKDTIQDWARCPSKIFYYLPYNRPIVTCKIGDPCDIIGDNAFYYEHDNVESMSRAILDAIQRSDSFSYPDGFIARHSWRSRAESFIKWSQGL